MGECRFPEIVTPAKRSASRGPCGACGERHAGRNKKARHRCRAFEWDPRVEPEGDDDMKGRSEEHTSELQSLMRISYAVFCLKKKNHNRRIREITNDTQNITTSIETTQDSDQKTRYRH